MTSDVQRPLLSAAIIVRDEAEHLRACLTSIREVCDEIVVVDTGSVDDSPNVAAEFGAVVGHRPWDDDFAAARNASLDLATGRWILYIDADERLDVESIEAARAELVDDAIALLPLFRARPHWSPYREYRLWQHRPDVRFSGRIHETMVPEVVRIRDEEGLAIRHSDQFSLVHYGYEGDQTRKHHRNLPLLERRVIEFPDRCYLWNHLANVHEALGNTEAAQQAWTTGIELIRRRGLDDRTDVLCYGGLGSSMVANGQDAAALIAEARQIAPWYRTLDWVEAKNFVGRGRYRAALEPLQRLIDTGPDPEDPTLTYNNSLFTDWAWALAGRCHLELGDRAAAATAYEQASRSAPDVLEYRTKAIALASTSSR